MVRSTFYTTAKLSVLCLLVALMPPSQAQPKTALQALTLSGIENSISNILTGHIITEAYRRIGVKVTIQYLPAARALAMSTMGRTDGEISRIFNIGERHKNLVRVPVPYLYLKVKVFSIKPNVKIDSITDLAKYKNGVVNGIIFSDKLTENYQRLKLASPYQLINMLVSRPNELDLVILSEITGRILIAQSFPEAGIIMASNSLQNIPSYHYLHESKKAWLPLIQKSLNDMIESGEILKMKEAFILNSIKVSK